MPAVADPSPFVGRSAELAQLTARLDRAIGGSGAVVLIAGDPGIGKTRLMDELGRHAAERGMRVLWGRCYEGEGAPAFWPWVQILRALVADAPPDAARAALGPGAAPVAALLPEIGSPVAEEDGAPSLDSAEARFRFFDAVAGLLRSSARRDGPLLLVVDDLHRADEPSLLLLHFVAAAIAGAPVLLVGAYRGLEVEAGDPLAGIVGGIARLPHGLQLTLGGLDRGAVGALASSAAHVEPSPALLAALARDTDGNPLFVLETLRLLGADGRLAETAADDLWRGGIPLAIRALIAQRIERLSPPAQVMLSTASVIGRDFEITALAAALGKPEGALAPLLAETEAAQVIERGGPSGRPTTYIFAHSLIRETLYTALPFARRVRLHGRVGDALAALHADDPDPPLAELAHHFSQAASAGDPATAVTYARRAGDRALALLAYEEAARLYELALHALELIPRADPLERAGLLLALGEAQTRAADASAGAAAFWRAAAAARTLRQGGRDADAAAILARAALGIAGLTLPADEVAPPLLELLFEALGALGETDSPLRAQILARLATDLRDPTRRPERESLSAEAVAVARRAGDPRALTVALLGRHNVLRGTVDLEGQLALASEALREAEAARDADLAMWAYRLRVVDLLEIGDRATFEEDAAAHRRLAERLREPYHLWQAAVWDAMRDLLEGRFAAAEAQAERALALGLRGPADLARFFHALQLAAIRTEHGAADAAIGAVAPVIERFSGMILQGASAVLLPLFLAADRRADAEREYERLIAAAPGADLNLLPRRGVWLAVIPQLAAAAAAFDDADRAAGLYAMLLPDDGRIAMASPGIVCYGPVARYLGLLAATARRWDDAARHFEDALATEERFGAPAWLARTRVEYAAMLMRRAGAGASRDGDDHGTARGLLTEALAGARAMQMAHLIARAEELFAALPRPAPRAPRPAPAGLSTREIDVLRLLAAGKTNAEIAALLILSPSTVKRHAENIYRKIGARRRADAIAFAIRLGLTDA